MHIINQKLSFDIFMVRNVQNIFMEHLNILMIFGIQEKIDNFDPYNVFLAVATNIPSDLRLVLCSRVTYSLIKSLGSVRFSCMFLNVIYFFILCSPSQYNNTIL